MLNLNKLRIFLLFLFVLLMSNANAFLQLDFDNKTSETILLEYRIEEYVSDARDVSSEQKRIEIPSNTTYRIELSTERNKYASLHILSIHTSSGKEYLQSPISHDLNLNFYELTAKNLSVIVSESDISFADIIEEVGKGKTLQEPARPYKKIYPATWD